VDLGALFATFGVDSSQLKRLEGELNNVDRQAASTFGNMGGYASSAMSQIAGIVGVTLTVAGAFYAVERAVRFSIQAQEEFRIKTIEIGSGLTNLAKEGQGSYEKMFRQNFQYAQKMYEEIRKEDAKRFASADDLMTAYNALVQKGYGVRLDEVDALGVLTDKIKLATAGQNTQLQINQEIRGLLDGQVRAGSLLGMELQSRLGPQWKDLVAQHRNAGTLLQWLASMWPGIAAACAEVEKTLEAQSTTLTGNLKSIGRQGMEGAYIAIVNILRDINDYLRENEAIIVDKIVSAWTTVEFYTRKVLDNIESMNKATSVSVPTNPQERTTGQQAFMAWREAFDPINWMNSLLTTGKFLWNGIIDSIGNAWDSAQRLSSVVKDLMDYISETSVFKNWYDSAVELKAEIEDIKSKVSWLVGIFSSSMDWVVNVRFGGLPAWLGSWFSGPQAGPPAVPVPRITVPDKSLETAIKQAQDKARGLVTIGLPTQGVVTVPYSMVPEKWGGPAVGQTVPKPPPAGKEKGGKGAEAEANRLMSLYDTLTKDIARLSEGRLSEVDANLEKTIDQIYKKTEQRAVSEAEVEVLARKRAALQKAKIEEDFWSRMARESGDAYAAIRVEADNWLKDTQGIQGAAAAIEEWRIRKTKAEDINRLTESLGMQKQFYDQMAQLSPELQAQNRYKQLSLDLENKMALLAIDKLLAEKRYLEPLREQLYAQQEMVNGAKQFNLEMEKNKGLSGWAFRRAQEVQSKDTISDLVSGLESSIANAWTTGFDAFLAQDQQGMQKAAANLVKSFMSEIVKRNITMLFDQVALKMKPEQAMTSGAQQAGQVLTQAGNTCGQNILSYAQMAAQALSGLRPGGSPVGGQGGGGIPLGGMPGGGGISLGGMPGIGEKPGGLGGAGGGGLAAPSGLGGYDSIMSEFAPATDKFLLGATKFEPGSIQFAATPNALNQAAMSAEQAAFMGQMSNAQLGMGAIGLGLGAVGLLTGSKELVAASMVLQLAAVALQIAALIMKVSGFIPGAAQGAIVSGHMVPVHSFADGAPRISAPTLAWVGEGANEEAVIPLQRGAVPVRLSGKQSAPGLVYAPTLNIGDGVSRDDKEWFKRELRRHKEEIYTAIKTGNRNFVRMK